MHINLISRNYSQDIFFSFLLICFTYRMNGRTANVYFKQFWVLKVKYEVNERGGGKINSFS